MGNEVDNLRISIDLYTAIKNDDIDTFATITFMDKNLSLSLGRFPLLTLCYIFDSKKIIAQYENRLIRIGNYEKTIEPMDFELNDRFVKLAKKSIKLYIQDDSIVSPLEILMLLEKYDYISNIYSVSYKNTTIIDNMSYISKYVVKENIDMNAKSFKIKNRKLKPRQKVILSIYGIASMIMSVAMVLMMIFQPIFIGRGSIDSPYMIYSEMQLIEIMQSTEKSKGNYRLACDIVLTKEWQSIEEFSGVLEGNNHKIVAGAFITKEFVRLLSGTIKDIKFVLDYDTISVSGNRGFIVLGNKDTGSIINVDVEIATVFTISETLVDDTKSYIVSTLCYENAGIVDGCDISMDYTINSNGGINMYLAGVVGVNYGVIKNTTTMTGSSITATNVDVAGVVAYNAIGLYKFAEIENVTNNADIVVSTNISAWSPIVSGVCVDNRGIMTNVENEGNITLNEENQSTEEYFSRVAGVVGTNYYGATKLSNTGSITANVSSTETYIGGVIAYTDMISLNIFSIVDNCYNVGNISVTNTNSDKNVIVGSVVGNARVSAVRDSFSCVESIVAVSQNKYIGNICGIVSDFVVNNSTALILNNKYVKNGISGIGAIFEYSAESLSVVLNDIDGDFALGFDTLDELKSTNIYWE